MNLKITLMSSVLMLFMNQFDIYAQDVEITGPAGSGSFGEVTVLTNGNFVVIDQFYDEGATANVGAVYLYNGSTKALISTLKGSQSNDQIGSKGIVILSNGNFVVLSPKWANGASTNAGAVTWCSATSGTSGVVSSSNSLVGTSASDGIGGFQVKALTNGNYVVNSPYWNNGAVTWAGAVTWCNGTTGRTGAVSSSNSLVGSTLDDRVGYEGVTPLSNGHYVVRSVSWDNGVATNAGAVTWGNGTSGRTGAVSSANSLVGSSASDEVGFSMNVLTNANYVVGSYKWNNGATADVGAVTWCNGTTGRTGAVSSSNSLVGSTANDQVGNGEIGALTNGHYVVISTTWDNGATVNAGAATWCNGTTGRTGAVSSANSLVGSISGDLGGFGVSVLSNGNYVVRSPYWDNGAVADAGAVTWCNGTTGRTGVISSSNSLVGSKAFDLVGETGLTILNNGNYVVVSSKWDNGTATDAGAITWSNGTSGSTGVVSDANSLVGSTSNDNIGSLLRDLNNGNYVVLSSNWDNGSTINAGAVTWCSGTTGRTGAVSASNSLVGAKSSDLSGSNVITLNNGNYLVKSPYWDNGATTDAGAVTWCDGTAGLTATISTANSLVGTTASDQVGSNTLALSNGNYLVGSPYCNIGALTDAGAATWCNGTTGTVGTVSSANSLVGSKANDNVGNSLYDFASGKYGVHSTNWDNGVMVNGSALTMGDGASGTTGVISSCNSVLGEVSNGISFAVYNSTYNYLIVQKNNSNKLTISDRFVLQAAGVTISSSDADNVICSGESVTFTATPTNGGTTPTYQWKINGTDVSGEVNATFTTTGLVNGNNVTVEMVSNYPCVKNSPATSNGIITTVNSATADTPPADIRACSSYTLPALNAGNNYYTGTGGTGTLLLANSDITSTQTIYIYAVNGACTDEKSFVANIYDCIQLDVASCNTTQTNLTDAVYAETVVGATDYRFKVVHSATSYEATNFNTSNLFRLSWLTANPVKYGTTYTISASAKVGGLWMPFGNTCTVTTPATRLQASYANTTLAALTDALYSYEVADATDYKYEIRKASDNSFVASSVRGTNDNLFRLSWISGGLIENNTSYKIRVSAYVGGSWQAYGPEVTINSPIATQLATGSCGANIPTLSTALYSDNVASASNYRYEIRLASDNSLITVSTRGTNDNLFRLSWVSGIQLNTTYSIKVAAYAGSSWSSYGTACTVTTPSAMVLDEDDNGLSGRDAHMSGRDASRPDSAREMHIFPNPNNGNFTIRTDAPGAYQLLNELGQVIREIEVPESGATDVEGLGAGVYFLWGEAVTQKIVVQ